MTGALNQPTFASVYSAHKDAIYTYVYYRVNGDTDVAADVVSDVFLKAYKNFGSYDSRYSIHTWLYTITKRTLIDYYRRAKTHIDIDEIDVSDGTDPLFELVNAKANSLDIERALETLPEIQSTCIRAQFWGGETSPEIAERLNISPAAVRKHVSRGLATLRSALAVAVLAVVQYLPHI
jgi:RNA polymerase sigma-70 factor (ECF subfamily)